MDCKDKEKEMKEQQENKTYFRIIHVIKPCKWKMKTIKLYYLNY